MNTRKINMVFRLSHRQRWIIYSFKDIYHILYQLIDLLDDIYHQHNRKIVTTFWSIINNIIHTNAAMGGRICYTWEKFIGAANEVIEHYANNMARFRSHQTKKDNVIYNIRYYVGGAGSTSSITFPRYYINRNYIMEDHKKRDIDAFHIYSYTIRKDNAIFSILMD